MSPQELVSRLVLAYPRLKPTSVARNVAFGVVMNTVNSDGETLQSKLGVDLAKKVTSDVLKELGYPSDFAPTVVDF